MNTIRGQNGLFNIILLIAFITGNPQWVVGAAAGAVIWAIFKDPQEFAEEEQEMNKENI